MKDDDQTIRQRIDGRSLALELARELQECSTRALSTITCSVPRLIERRCVLLGLSTPQTAVLQIVDEAQVARVHVHKIRLLSTP